jgi:hypothetical protein
MSFNLDNNGKFKTRTMEEKKQADHHCRRWMGFFSKSLLQKCPQQEPLN